MSDEKLVCLLVGLHGLLNKCLHLDFKIVFKAVKQLGVTVQSNIAISVSVLHLYNISCVHLYPPC